jgi:hypothetical protein
VRVGVIYSDDTQEVSALVFMPSLLLRVPPLLRFLSFALQIDTGYISPDKFFIGFGLGMMF